MFKEGELEKESVLEKLAYTAADSRNYNVDFCFSLFRVCRNAGQKKDSYVYE